MPGCMVLAASVVLSRTLVLCRDQSICCAWNAGHRTHQLSAAEYVLPFDGSEVADDRMLS